MPIAQLVSLMCHHVREQNMTELVANCEHVCSLLLQSLHLPYQSPLDERVAKRLGPFLFSEVLRIYLPYENRKMLLFSEVLHYTHNMNRMNFSNLYAQELRVHFYDFKFKNKLIKVYVNNN